MNEKLQYASMLEIPVNTCSVNTLKPKKKRFFKKKKVSAEEIKEQLLKKVNEEQEEPIALEEQTELAHNAELSLDEENKEKAFTDEQMPVSASVFPAKVAKKRKRLKFSVMGVQMVVIGALVATIFLTNAIYADSGINVFLKNVFGTSAQVVDSREFSDFSPTIAMGDNIGIQMQNGVITFGGEGSVYAPCNGLISQIIKADDGTFDVIISHSANFNSVITGIDHLYAEEGQKVYANIPIGYLKPNGATMTFTDQEGKVLVDYQIVGNTVVWQA